MNTLMQRMMILMIQVIVGNRILDSQFGQGLLQLANDGLGAAQLIGGVIVLCIFIMTCIKKSNESEEQGRKRYTSWQIALVIIFVFILGAKEIINLVLSYFGLSLGVIL